MKRTVGQAVVVLLALAAATAATEASFALGAELTFEWYLAAVACIAWRCGRPAATAAALGSMLLTDYLYLPFHRFTFGMGVTEAIGLATFVGLALLVAHLVAARDSAEQERAGRERVFAMVTRELANLVRAFHTWTTILERPDVPRDARDRAARALGRATHALGTLSGDLIDWPRIAAGRIELAREDLDLAELVEDAVEEVREDAEAKAVTLSCSLFPAPVHADRDRLHQVALNVLADSLHSASPGGTVSIAVRSTEQRAILSVHADGPVRGMPDPGTPVDDRRASFALALARQLMRAQGGDVTTYGGGFRGEGATVLVRLPATGPPRTAPSSRATSAPGAAVA